MKSTKRTNREPRYGPERGDFDSARPGGSRSRRAAALLEVVISLSILLVAMSAIGVIFRTGYFHVEHAERMNQATLMTDRLLTAVDLGMISPGDREQTGAFSDETIPDMSWSMEAQPIEAMPGLFHIRVSIFMGDPTGKDAQHLLTTYVLRAEPRNVNLETDFGIPAEQLDMLTDSIPGGAAVADLHNFNPKDIAKLPLDQLKELLPVIMQALGVALNPGQMDDLMKALQKGDLSGVQNIAGQAGLGAKPPGGQPKGAAPPSGAPPKNPPFMPPKNQQQPPQGQPRGQRGR